MFILLHTSLISNIKGSFCNLCLTNHSSEVNFAKKMFPVETISKGIIFAQCSDTQIMRKFPNANNFTLTVKYYNTTIRVCPSLSTDRQTDGQCDSYSSKASWCQRQHDALSYFEVTEDLIYPGSIKFKANTNVSFIKLRFSSLMYR